MVFTSTVFLGLFLPLLFAVYFLANTAARPYVLLLFSLIFYAWGEPSAVVVMIALMVLNYLLALGIAALGNRRAATALLALAVVSDLGALVGYKYLGFLAANLQPLCRLAGVEFAIRGLPPGIRRAWS